MLIKRHACRQATVVSPEPLLSTHGSTRCAYVLPTQCHHNTVQVASKRAAACPVESPSRCSVIMTRAYSFDACHREFSLWFAFRLA
jgi:hypothetical protein